MAASGTYQLSALSVGKNGSLVTAPKAPEKAMVVNSGKISDGTKALGIRRMLRSCRSASDVLTARVVPPGAVPPSVTDTGIDAALIAARSAVAGPTGPNRW